MADYDFRKTASTRKPLYGHDSMQNAYIVDDYPAGFRARCRMRVWLEYKPKQGYRLVEQTSEKWYPGEEPSGNAGLRWNKPKASTYVPIAACMFLDENDHVQWAVLGFGSNPDKVYEFIRDFPKADRMGIKALVIQQLSYIKGKLEGRLVFVMNDNPQPWSDHELGEARNSLEEWAEVAHQIGLKVPESIQNLIDGKVAPQKVDPEEFKAEQKKREDDAKARLTEEAKNTPGALSRAQFIERLQSKVKMNGRVLNVSPDRGDYSDLFVNLYNASEADAHGADAENNRQAFVIEGFDRKDQDQAVVKVKVSLRLNHIGGDRAGREKSNMRAKTGTPAKIADYLAEHISRIVSEFEPRIWRR
jgi:hypothetical protein